MISLSLKLFGDSMDLWHVAILVCALISYALLENKLEKFYLFLKAMRLKTFKSHIFCVHRPNLTI